MITLRGVAWNNTRSYVPLIAASQRFEELHPDVQIAWDKASLSTMLDDTNTAFQKDYDLVVTTNGWIDYCSKQGLLAPLDEWLNLSTLQEQEMNSVGQSFQSYQTSDHQWALAIDASSQVSAYRPDLLRRNNFEIPQSWKDVVTMSAYYDFAIPLTNQDVLAHFYAIYMTLAAYQGVKDKDLFNTPIAEESIELLTELCSNIDKACFNWSSVQVFEAMTTTDQFVYCPLGFGYSNYAKTSYVTHPLKFCDTPYLVTKQRIFGSIGGSGIAINESSQYKRLAARFIEFISSPRVQTNFIVNFGGQPGCRRAWLNPAANEATGDYFINTLAAQDRAAIRPRLHFQMESLKQAGNLIRNHLKRPKNSQLVARQLAVLSHQMDTKNLSSSPSCIGSF